MQIIVKLILVIGLLTLFEPATAALRVFACEPEWAALTQALGGDHVEVFTATTALQDPHRIEARPSLIAQVRRADLITCSGADLEVGWLPLLLRQAGNARVQPGKPGYFEAAAQVERLEIPRQVDRSQGDVHPAGNPHVHLDPRRLLEIATALSARLGQIDPANTSAYQTRLADFKTRLTDAIRRWETQAAPLKGAKAVVHHKNWVYLFDWLGMQEVGTLEPKPGLPPTAGHLAGLKQTLAQTPAEVIVRTVYNDPRGAEWLHAQTGTPIAILPYTIGGTEQANDLFGLFEETLKRLLTAIHEP